MAIDNFIPTIWSETLLTELDRQYIGVANCNRVFEGDIKEKGSKVKICGIGNISVNDYTKNTDMSLPQDLHDTVFDLTISEAKYFNFQIDDIDKAQSVPKLMESAMKVAANALANEADKYVYNLFRNSNINMLMDNATSENIIDKFIDARTLLCKNNVFNSDDIVIEVSPEIAAIIIKSKLMLASDNTNVLEHGCIGSIAGCKVFVSNNIVQESGMYNCLVRTKRAVAFAEQLSEIEAYRPEKRFADAVKGLHLYGAQIVYPQEFIVISIRPGV